MYRRTPPGTPIHFSSCYDVPVPSPLPPLNLPPIISSHDYVNNLPSIADSPPMSPVLPINNGPASPSFVPPNPIINGKITSSVNIYFCLWPTAEGPSNYLSSSSGHFISKFLGYTSGLNLTADLGPVLALLTLMF